MRIKTIYFLSLLIILIVLLGCSKEPKGPGKYDTFAKCLSENGATMYGTEWCSHCRNQKAKFGNSFQYIDYVDCDRNKRDCLAAGVSGYPTWNIKGTNYPGEQSLYKLASLSGCSLIQDE